MLLLRSSSRDLPIGHSIGYLTRMLLQQAVVLACTVSSSSSMRGQDGREHHREWWWPVTGESMCMRRV